MRFEIDFNKETNDKLLEQIGAKLVPYVPTPKYGPDSRYLINIDTFEELEILLEKVDVELNSGVYAAVVSFDPPTIYLDNNV
jgi:hypothetical protein